MSSGSTAKLDGIPLWLLVIMSSLALLGIIYAIAIIIFNIAKAKNKIIKMTSPNINILMLVGVILAYSCLVILGLDSGYVGKSSMEKLHAATTFVIPLTFTVIYGCLFAKSWRVFLVFKNINFNGKLTRDEHLLIGILVMLVIDLAIVLPWYFVDPIVCNRRIISTVYEADISGTVNYEVDDCRSELQGLWIGLLYLYKALMIVAGLYFTWQTRNITLPSLKDAKLIYIVVYSIISLAVIALPTLLISYVGMKIRYASGGLILWMVLTLTTSVLFVPKIYLERKNRDAANNVSSFNFLFSESMRKTQEAVRKCSLCFCCGSANDSERYAQEMLANEIDTLKRTIRQKDSTIRELNDRLYIGTEKFHEYLTTPKTNRSALQIMQEKYEARKKLQQQHETGAATDGNEITLHCPKPQNAAITNGFLSNGQPNSRAYTSTPQRPLKNHDYEDIYTPNEDEGIYSSDSNVPNTLTRQNRHNSDDTDGADVNHHSHIQNTYNPIQTVSNGYITTDTSNFTRTHSDAHSHTIRVHNEHHTSTLPRAAQHSRSHSQVSLGSQRSRHSAHHHSDYQHSNQQHNKYNEDNYYDPDSHQNDWRLQQPSPNQDSAFDDNTPSSDGYGHSNEVKYNTQGGSTGNVNKHQDYYDAQKAHINNAYTTDDMNHHSQYSHSEKDRYVRDQHQNFNNLNPQHRPNEYTSKYRDYNPTEHVYMSDNNLNRDSKHQNSKSQKQQSNGYLSDNDIIRDNQDTKHHQQNNGYKNSSNSLHRQEDNEGFPKYNGVSGNNSAIGHKLGITQEDRQFSQIDIGAMEYDAIQRTPTVGRRDRFYKPIDNRQNVQSVSQI